MISLFFSCHFQVELIEEGTPRKLKVHYKLLETGEEKSIECNTVSLLNVVANTSHMKINGLEAQILLDYMHVMITEKEQNCKYRNNIRIGSTVQSLKPTLHITLQNLCTGSK